MKLLAIDSSTKTFSICLSDQKKVLFDQNIKLDGVLSSSIISDIDKGLKKIKWKLTDVDGFVVGLGPGSFTGLRVGLSTIKGFAFVTGKPVVGISSFDAIALSLPVEKGQICVLTDARRDMVYACCYDKDHDVIKIKSPYQLTSIGLLLKNLKGSVYFAGDAIHLYKDVIEKKSSRFVFVDEKFWDPQAKYLADIAIEKFRKKEYDNIDELVPLYLYPEDCQVKGDVAKNK